MKHTEHSVIAEIYMCIQYEYADLLLFIIAQGESYLFVTDSNPCGKREIMCLSTLLDFTMYVYIFVHTSRMLYSIDIHSIHSECIFLYTYSFFCLPSSFNPPSFTFNRIRQRFCNTCMHMSFVWIRVLGISHRTNMSFTEIYCRKSIAVYAICALLRSGINRAISHGFWFIHSFVR